MNERPLYHQEEDIIALATSVIRQADSMPDYLVERHASILDFYLDACPEQATAIIDFIANYDLLEWDD